MGRSFGSTNPSMRTPPDVRTRIRPPDALAGKPDAMRPTCCPAKLATALDPCGSPQRLAPLAMSGVPRTSQASAGVYGLGAGEAGAEGGGAGGFGVASVIGAGAGSTREKGRPSL